MSRWVCPSCVTVWPEKPLVDGTIGCPECGNAATEAFACIVDESAGLAEFA